MRIETVKKYYSDKWEKELRKYRKDSDYKEFFRLVDECLSLNGVFHEKFSIHTIDEKFNTIEFTCEVYPFDIRLEFTGGKVWISVRLYRTKESVTYGYVREIDTVNSLLNLCVKHIQEQIDHSFGVTVGE